MLVIATIFSTASSIAGLLAASIAIGGFIAHAQPTLTGKADPEVRFATVVGGLGGLGVAILVMVGIAFTM